MATFTYKNKLALILGVIVLVFLVKQILEVAENCFSTESCNNYRLELRLKTRKFWNSITSNTEAEIKPNKHGIWDFESQLFNGEVYPVDETWINNPHFYDIALKWAKSWEHNYTRIDPIKLKSRKKYRIMFFDKFFWYQVRMDRYLYDWLEAAQRHPDLEVTLWGPGFIGWDNSLSPLENLEKKYGCDYFDWIIAHPEEIKTHLELIPLQDEFFYHEMVLPKVCGRTKLFHELHDCFDGFCLEQFTPNAHVISLRYAFIPFELLNVRRPETDRLKYVSKPENAKLFTYNPDCANIDVFHPLPWEEKTSQAVLFGQLAVLLYPLREKIISGIEKKVINATHYKHPGYNMPYNGSVLPPVYYNRSNPEIQNSVKNQIMYSQVLAQTKICIFDSSVVRKLVRKFIEAFMVGCVVASDLPFEMEEVFRDVVIRIDSNLSEEQIGELIQRALDDETELKRKAAKAMVIARKYFSCEGKTERLLQTLQEYEEGFRGYTVPFGFRIGCHSYDISNVPHKEQNPWCAHAN